jgi:hypothetical protein
VPVDPDSALIVMTLIGNMKEGNMRLVSGLLSASVTCLVSLTVSTGVASDNPKPIRAEVVVTNDGPMQDCPAALPPGANPPDSCLTFLYVFVRNSNSIDLTTHGPGRDLVPNAFVVTNVEVRLTVNGGDCSICNSLVANLTPPPNGTLNNGASWPMTVRCQQGTGNCTLGKPAVLPQERVAVTSFGWAHGADEPDGSYVFTVTVHGTVNGDPVDATDALAAIEME